MAFFNKTLLRLLTDYEQFKKLNSSIALDRFDTEERAILSQLRKYWKSHADTEFSMDVFSQKFFIDVPSGESDKTLYRHVFDEMLKPADPDIAKNMIRDLRTMAYHKAVEDAQTAYTIGEDIDLYETIVTINKEFENDIRNTVRANYCTAGIQEIIEDSEIGSSLGWKLRCLNASMPTSGTGNQIILAMRPGMGKTSFCADNGVYWLGRLREIGEPRPVVYFNNEGHMIKIKASFLRSALGKTLEQIKSMGYDAAERAFYKAIGGPDMLRIYNSHRLTNMQMERIIEKDNPGVVFFDMIGNIHMVGKPKDREDLSLEAKYQWARECAVQYDFLSIGVCQISAKGLDQKTGKSLQYIPASALKDSQTAVQGACDAIITIGSKDEEGFENSRYINVAKLFKGPCSPDADPACRTQVVFDGSICRYFDPKVV